MPETHLRYGGSTIARTLSCPGWRHHADRLPPARGSAYADRGTRLHEAMERVYDNPLTMDDALRAEKAQLWDDDAEALQTAFDAAEEALDAADAEEILLEPFVRLAGFEEIAGGSLDLGAVSTDGRTVLILDYKFGHQPVHDHRQLGFYAVCLRDSRPDLFKRAERVVTAIVQPATDPVLREQEWSLLELAAFRDDVVRAIERAQHSTDTHAGPWCRFCPAAPVCPAKKRAASAFLSHDPAALSELGAAMDLVEEMKEQIKAIEAAAFAQLEAGNPVPGWKLVEKQKRRYWVDEDATRKALRYAKGVKREQYIEESLRSPAQVEKAIKGCGLDLSPLIDTRASGNTLAPASDPREPVHTPGNVPAALDAAMRKTG